MCIMPLRLDLRQQGQLRIQHGDAGEVELVAPQVAKMSPSRAACSRLEAGRAEIAQHGVIAGLVGLVEREQRGADQNQDAVAVDLRGLRLRGGLGVLRERNADRAAAQSAPRAPKPSTPSSSHQAKVTPTRPPTSPLVKPTPTTAIENNIVADAHERRRAEGVGAVVAAPVGRDRELLIIRQDAPAERDGDRVPS